MAKKNPLKQCVLVIAIIVLSGCDSGVLNPETVPPPSQEQPAMENGNLSGGIPIEEIVRDKDGMVQLVVPGGIYLRGSTEEEVAAGINLCQQHYQPCNSWYYEQEFPPHEVTISPFLIDQSEVTNQQYRSCVESGSCTEPLVCKKGEPTYLDPDMADHPVVCVDWEEANNYCTWVGSRLPTEAEWEYAFRGDMSLIYPWGDEFDGTKVNFCDVNCDQDHADDAFDDGFSRSAPVGSFPLGESWSGMQSMAGNVSEWVSDWYGDYEPDKLVNPAGPSSGDKKLIKGCSWYSPAAYCRGATRGTADPTIRFDYLGFRCAANTSPEIDGSIQKGEWDQAENYLFEDGSILYLLYSEEHLYLAIKATSTEMISANVFISDDDGIKILHTSAALGTAVYQPEGETWRKTKDFEWCCRSTMDNTSSRAMREAFYHTENWLGINTYNGNENELEYKVSLSGSERYLAVNFLRVDNIEDKYVWPVGISDGPAEPTVGKFPDTMDFSPENWLNIEELQ